MGKFKIYALAGLEVTCDSAVHCQWLERGLLELLQYRGNCLDGFKRANCVTGLATSCQVMRSVLLSDKFEPTLDSVIAAGVAAGQLDINTAKKAGFSESSPASTKNEEAIQAEIAAMSGSEEAKQKFLASTVAGTRAGEVLEEWEYRHAAACKVFCTFDFPTCTQMCLENLRSEWRDMFSLRLLVISVFLGGNYSTWSDAFAFVLPFWRMAAEGRLGEEKVGAELVLSYVLGWTAFGMEQTKTNLRAALSMCYEAMEVTRGVNVKYQLWGGPTPDDREKIQSSDGSESSGCPVPPLRMQACATDPTLAAKYANEPQHFIHSAPGGFVTAYAVHAVCHVYESWLDSEAGFAALNAIDEAYWTRGVHLAGHIWWHKALLALDTNRLDIAVELYTKHLKGCHPGDPFILSDATSLLWRLWVREQTIAVRGTAQTLPMPHGLEHLLRDEFAKKTQQVGSDSSTAVATSNRSVELTPTSPEQRRFIAAEVAELQQKWLKFSGRTEPVLFFDTHREIQNAAFAVTHVGCGPFPKSPIEVEQMGGVSAITEAAPKWLVVGAVADGFDVVDPHLPTVATTNAQTSGGEPLRVLTPAGCDAPKTASADMMDLKPNGQPEVATCGRGGHDEYWAARTYFKLHQRTVARALADLASLTLAGHESSTTAPTTEDGEAAVVTSLSRVPPEVALQFTKLFAGYMVDGSASSLFDSLPLYHETMGGSAAQRDLMTRTALVVAVIAGQVRSQRVLDLATRMGAAAHGNRFWAHFADTVIKTNLVGRV